jgi:RNA polymerase sigma factor (sigma-70 family)
MPKLKQREPLTEAEQNQVMANLGLVGQVVGRFARFEEYDDLFQEGVLELINSIRRFDASKGFEFSTYAGRCIKLRVKNARILNRMIRPSERIIFRQIREGTDVKVETEFNLDWFEARQPVNCEDESSQILSRLPEDQRNAIRATIIDGISGNQFSRTLGCSRSSIARRVRSGIKKLRHIIESERKQA